MNLISIVGARPQFIKLAPLHNALSKHPGINHIIIHTLQHYDDGMSGIFFKELKLPQPDYQLTPSDISIASNIVRMKDGITKILAGVKADMVIVFGDTNSTLAGAQAAKGLEVPISHIEAGLRSYDPSMPEEFNRIETDKLSDLLFCPTLKAIENLKTERFPPAKIIFSGDIMYDALNYHLPIAKANSTDLPGEPFVLATIHRKGTVQSPQILIPILKAFNEINRRIKIIFPVHPATRKAIYDTGERIEFELLEPFGYLRMLSLLDRCKLVLTDSGGIQKEAFFSKKMCVTIRTTTEWTELVEAGVNILCGTDYSSILNAFELAYKHNPGFGETFYGSGNSADIVVDEIIKFVTARVR